MASTTYDCGTGSTAIVTHPSKTGDKLIIDGVQSNNLTDQNLVFLCTGSLVISCPDGDYAVSIIPLPDQGLFNEVFLLMLAGLLCGGLFAWVLNKYGI